MGTHKLKIVISDFHLSRGKWLSDGRRNPLEDFHQDERFEELLVHYSTGPFADSEVELIVNGDFFDPLAVVRPLGHDGKFPELDYPLEVEEPAAVRKIGIILKGHPISVKALKDFLSRGKRIVFRWGNHDAVVLWPAVQALLREELSPPSQEQIEFQQHPYIFDRICVDHGHQYETLNQFNEQQIFIERKTRHGVRKIQNLPFGSFFVLGFLNHIKLKRSYINHVQPLRVYVRLTALMEPLSFIGNGIAAFWFFIKMRFITHPMRIARFGKTLKLIKEVFVRPSLEEAAEEIFAKQVAQSPGQAHTGEFDTIIMGHNHQATVRLFPGGKQYINTGTWIPITSLDMSSLGHQILRTYALIEYEQGKARASLKIWNGKAHLTDEFT